MKKNCSIFSTKRLDRALPYFGAVPGAGCVGAGAAWGTAASGAGVVEPVPSEPAAAGGVGAVSPGAAGTVAAGAAGVCAPGFEASDLLVLSPIVSRIDFGGAATARVPT